ncbi:phage baseplate upper protein [Staphylococcus equorum]|uniref:phage baseplate upper protein n=1 Tax=Staphylococcus equorum TaxID=246432 RepID=UPI0024078658|nr:phage baseplate upper protein [Staphylococcus equorum]MDG0821324.1 phage baseplate upper protein [Staphylococcus equorum]
MYNKEGKIKLETSAHYVPIGNTSITFYDSDIGTADLIFYITRNQRPLEVSDENVDCFLMLKAKDGTYIVDNANVVNPLNGKVKYTIPKEFLTHTGSVKGQLWIAVHGKEDIITEVEFSFTIKDSMFTTIPAVDKVNYIRTFDEIRERIDERVTYIEESLANGSDYVTQMDNTFRSSMKSLNDRSAQILLEIDDLANNHKKELNDLKNSSINELNDKAIDIKTDVEMLNNYDTTNWQKYKMTKDDGNRIEKSQIDILTLDTGFYEVWECTNTPLNDTGIYNLIVFGNNGSKFILATHSYSNRTFINTIHTNEDARGWKEVTNNNNREWLGIIGGVDSEYSSVLDLPAGFYECIIPTNSWEVNAPTNENEGKYNAVINVYSGVELNKQILLTDIKFNIVYIATFSEGKFSGWKTLLTQEDLKTQITDIVSKIMSERVKDTDWLPITIKNEYSKSSIPDFEPSYRIIDYHNHKKVFVRFGIENIKDGVNTVGNIPLEINPYKIYGNGTTSTAKIPPKIAILNGEIIIYTNLNDSYSEKDYVFYQTEWII